MPRFLKDIFTYSCRKIANSLKTKLRLLRTHSNVDALGSDLLFVPIKTSCKEQSEEIRNHKNISFITN